MGCTHGKTMLAPLAEEDLSYLVLNTQMQEDQLLANYRQFIKKHPDGGMDRETFRKVMRDCYPRAHTADIETHLFRMYDDNEVMMMIMMIETHLFMKNTEY